MEVYSAMELRPHPKPLPLPDFDQPRIDVASKSLQREKIVTPSFPLHLYTSPSSPPSLFLSSPTLSSLLPGSRPEIIEDPMDVIAIEGERVDFKLKVAGSPRPTIVWYHGACMVGPDYATQISDDGDLTFISVEPTHAGGGSQGWRKRGGREEVSETRVYVCILCLGFCNDYRERTENSSNVNASINGMLGHLTLAGHSSSCCTITHM